MVKKIEHLRKCSKMERRIITAIRLTRLDSYRT